MKRIVLFALVFMALAPLALAGTATMDFASDVGLLTAQNGSGSLTSSSGRAEFTGQNTSMLYHDGALVQASGNVAATMTLRPYTDAQNLVGIVMEAGGDWLQATCDGSGTVTLTDYIGNYRSYTFPYPNAGNNFFTLQYSTSTGRATLTLNNTHSVFLEDALEGATSVHVGVASGGPGGFVSLVASGTGIPDYPPVDPDTDGDGITDAAETEAGTDPLDPGNRPVSPSSIATTVTASSGVSVLFPANCISATIVVDIQTALSIPSASLPNGHTVSGMAVDLGPSGATFSIPVVVTLPYIPGQVDSLDVSTLTPYVYHNGAYTTEGISNVTRDPVARKVTFTTSHFSVFVLGGELMDADGDGVADVHDAFPHNPNGQSDSDGDGIGDEWEAAWFGDLTTADSTSDYDGDNVSDRAEFESYVFNLDPTDGTSSLPAASALATGIALALLGIRSARKAAKPKQ